MNILQATSPVASPVRSSFSPVQQQPAYNNTMAGMQRGNTSFSQTSSPVVAQQRGAPNYFGGGQMQPMSTGSSSNFSAPVRSPTTPAAPAPSSAKSGGGFDDLWTMSLGSSNTNKPAAGGNKSMKDLEKEKSNAGLWGGQAKPVGTQNAFGSFGNTAPPSASSGGGDDLLL